MKINQIVSESINSSDDNYVYILSSDNSRDSLSLNRCVSNIEALKKMLIIEYKENFGEEIIEDSIKIDEQKEIITFEYEDSVNGIEKDEYGFFKLELHS